MSRFSTYVELPINVYEDNQSTIKIALNPWAMRRTRHVEVRVKWISELVEDGKINLEYIDTKNQIADIFTKALSTETFESLRASLVMPLHTSVST